jgi:WD40 repeat protein
VKTLPRPGTGDATHVAFSPDGKRVASSYQDGLLRVWDLEIGKELFMRKAHPMNPTAVAFSPDGALVGTTGGVFDQEKQ